MNGCLLEELPKTLLGRIWPERRVLMGLRVCKWLQADLQSHAAGALLVVVSDAETIRHGISATMRRLAACKIYLDCQMLCSQRNYEIFSGMVAPHPAAMLVHLDLRKADVGGKEQGLLNVLKACSALVFLELSDVENVQHWSDIFKSLNNNKELKHLGIGGTSIDDCSAASLGALLAETSSLTSLCMDRSSFESVLIEETSNAMARHICLTRLNVRWVEMGAVGATTLSSMLRQHAQLQHLIVDHIEMGNSGMSALVEAISHCAELRCLDVNMNGIQGAAAVEFGTAVQSWPNLTSLSVSGNAFRDAGILSLCSSVARCELLSLLDLRQTDLGAAACGPDGLGAVLRNCRRLQRLDVTWNEAIGDQGALALSEALRQSPSLMNLDAAWCGIGSEGARALVGALFGMPSMVRADLQMNRIGRAEARRLDEASRALEGGRQFSLGILAQNKVPAALPE